MNVIRNSDGAAASSTRAFVTEVFELAASRRWPELAERMHPAAEVVVGCGGESARRLHGDVLHGWLEHAAAGARSYELEPRITSIDIVAPDVALATGTLRTLLPDRGHVLTQATWVLVLKEGLLYRAERRPTFADARALAQVYVADAGGDDRLDGA